MTKSRGLRGGSLEKRFWMRVEKHEGCWRWTGMLSWNGYGRFMLTESGRRREAAHRVSWRIHYGNIPSGMSVLHRCDNPCCVNPAHLFLGTAADNAADKVAKGRQARRASHGRTKLSEADVAKIRWYLERGLDTQVAIGRLFGVSNQVIYGIKHGKTWKSAETKEV